MEMTTTKVAASAAITNNSVRRARSSGADIGIDTTCAPMVSPTFQPNPFCEPYKAIIVGAATSGVLWQAFARPAVAFSCRGRGRQESAGVLQTSVAYVLSGMLSEAV